MIEFSHELRVSTSPDVKAEAARQPQTFGAYAPDPDADFAAGRAAGIREARRASPVAPVPYIPDTLRITGHRPGVVYQLVRAILIVFGVAAAVLLAWPK